MAIRLEKALGSTAEAWLTMQAAYDLAQVREHEGRWLCAGSRHSRR